MQEGRTPITKTQKEDDRSEQDEPPSKRPCQKDNDDALSPNPSIVVHVRFLSDQASEADLMEALSSFGQIAYACVKPNKHMALVEFETLEGARLCVEFAANNEISVVGQIAHFNYSTSKHIQRSDFECAKPNHVLALTISNIKYPITVSVLNNICSPHGEVRRIRIVKKTHLIIALVQFDSIAVATAVKHAINGADIYAGCCTLRVEYAECNEVKINSNGTDQRDFTAPSQAASPKRKTFNTFLSDAADFSTTRSAVAGSGDVLAQMGGAPTIAFGPASAYPCFPQPFAGYDPYAHSGFGYEAFILRNQEYSPFVDPYAIGYGTPYGYGEAVAPYPNPTRYLEFDGDPKASGSLLMIYGLDHTKVNCEMIFNILCQYGDVVRVKFLRSKVNTGMVEMASSDHVGCILKYLQDVRLFGMKIELKSSFQTGGLREVKVPFNLPDGSPSFRDFSGSRYLRFANPEIAAKNRCMYPSTVLYWFNSPPDMTEDRIREVFIERKAPSPISVSIFPTKSKRSSSGFAEFESEEKATEALALANHTPVVCSEGEPPYIVKMAFGRPRNATRDSEGASEKADSTNASTSNSSV